ncbi:putative signal transducing protein [Massilia sp. SYSU DXS3249]
MEQALNAWLAAHPDIEAIPGRDLFIVARYLIPMEATLMQGCLEASGIPAVLADAHLMQTDLLLAPALGGVRILVPLTYIQQAQAVIEAFGRGDFALTENMDGNGIKEGSV